MRISRSAYFWVALLTIGATGLCQNLAERVLGRVSPLDQKPDPRTTAVSVWGEANGESAPLGKGSIDADGFFSFGVPRTTMPRTLVVQAEGYAPLEVPIAETPNGEGLWVGDLRPERGAALRITVANPELLGPDAVARLYAEPDQRRTIDLDRAPLAEAPFRNGVAVFDHVARGFWAIVVTDDFKTFAPRVWPWKMGSKDAWAPPLWLEAGGAADIEVIAAGEETIEGYCETPAGSWHPFGGAEYVLRHRPFFEQPTHGRFRWNAAHLPTSLQALHVYAGSRAGRFEFCPIGRSLKFEVPRGAKLTGQVRESGGGPIARARVRLGARRVECDDEGRYAFLGLEAGEYELSAFAEKFTAAVTRKLVVVADADPVPEDFFLERPCVLTGVIVDRKRKPVADVMVGFQPVERVSQRIGEPVFDVSNGAGEFKMTRLDRGRGIVYATPAANGYGEASEIEIAAGVENKATLEVAIGGVVLGKAAYVSQRPAARAIVTLVSRQIPVEEIFRRPPLERRRPWIERMTITGEDGTYGFPDVPPGGYHLLIDAPGRPPFYAGAIEVAEGKNRNGFDWIVGKLEPRKIVLPPFAAVRIGNWNSPVNEEWLGAGPETTEFDWSENYPGFLHFSRLADPVVRTQSTDLTVSFGSETVDRGEGDLVIVEGAAAPPIESKVYGRVRGTVTINGGAVDPIGCELTAYPVDSSPDATPRRVFVDPKSGQFEVQLPRGSHLLVARAPAFANGVFGPFAVATGMENGTVEGATVDCPTSAQVSGRATAARDLDVNALIDVFAEVTPWWRRLVGKWRPPVPAARVVGGSYYVDGVTPGQGMVVVGNDRSRGVADVDLGAGQLTKAPDVMLVPRADARSLAPGGFETVRDPNRDDWIYARRRAPFEETSRSPSDAEVFVGVEPRLYTRRSLVEFVDRPIVESRAFLVGLRADESLERALSPGTYRWRAGVIIDGRRPADVVHMLAPVVRDEYAFGYPFVALDTAANGMAEFTGLVGGAYESIVRWFGDDGRLYRKHTRIRVGRGDENNGKGAVEFKTGAVKFRLTLPSDEPAAGAVVRITSADYRGRGGFGRLAEHRQVIVEGVCPKDGEMEFTSLPAGAYDVEILHDSAGAKSVQSIEIDPARPVKTHAVALPVRATLAVTLKSESKAPLVGARVHVVDQNGSGLFPMRRLLSNADGKVSTQSVGPGRYTVFATTASGVSFYVGSIDLTAGAIGSLEATAPRTGTISITVKDEIGHAVGGALVRIAEKGRGDLWAGPGRALSETYPTAADEFGYFTSRSLAAGGYEVIVSADGYLEQTLEVALAAGAAEPLEVVLKKSDEKH